MKPYLLLAIVLLPGFNADSQQPLVGSIQGIVRDQHGAPLAGAAVTATNIDAVEPENHRHNGVTDQHGIFQLVDLAPGRYSIVVQARGYRDYTISEVDVHDGEAVKLPDIRMSRPNGK